MNLYFSKLATTQLSITYARRAFPCFDELQLKANFTIGIIRQENYIAISNVAASNEGEYVNSCINMYVGVYFKC